MACFAANHLKECNDDLAKCIGGLCRCVGMYVGDGKYCRSKKPNINGSGMTRRVNKILGLYFWAVTH